jgi:hypothetical protein
VKFGVILILVVSLSLMIEKNCFVVNPFVVLSHWFCHLAVLWSLTCWTISLGTCHSVWLAGILHRAPSWFHLKDYTRAIPKSTSDWLVKRNTLS